MNKTELQKIIAKGEGFASEFKRCENGLSNSVFETVCAFSNRYGGHLVLGVADNGDIFRCIVPLDLATPAVVDSYDKPTDKATDKVTDKVTDKMTSGDKRFLEEILPHLKKQEWIANAEVRTITGRSAISTKRFLGSLAKKGILEAHGEKKARKYRLAPLQNQPESPNHER